MDPTSADVLRSKKFVWRDYAAIPKPRRARPGRQLECRRPVERGIGGGWMRLRRERLRELRRALNLTQEQIADAVGCARSTVSTWETAGNMPRPAVLRHLAEFLGTTVNDLTVQSAPSSLRALRVAAGMRQVDIARMLGVGTPTYCDVETGRQGIPSRWIPALALALGVLPDTLRAAGKGRSVSPLPGRVVPAGVCVLTPPPSASPLPVRLVTDPGSHEATARKWRRPDSAGVPAAP
ncbi:helix-turn-helix transcriptional regulator [Streptomyces jumonjinensis]|uniref:helix-turn-helix transcriptional regulator n=1 Tax=Streptomyces jumonjinensis TaxID=1945 RepID=UPI00378E4CB9